jgi:hypothetical protein
MAMAPRLSPNYDHVTLLLPRQGLSRSLMKLGMLTRQVAILSSDENPSPRELTKASRALCTSALETQASMSRVQQDDPPADVAVLVQAVGLTIELAMLFAGVLDPTGGPGRVLAA